VAVTALGTAVPLTATSATTTSIAAIQGNVPQPGLDFNSRRRAVLDNHVRETMVLAAGMAAGTRAAPDVVIWPENSSDIDPLLNSDAAQEIQAATDAVKVPIVIGAVLQQPVNHVSNAAILWGTTLSGHPGPGASYVKRHPAPFAEYIPFRGFFRNFNSHVDDVTRDFVPGDHVGVFHTGTLAIGDVICFEVAYDDLVQDPVRAGADVLVVQTNNATFGYSDESAQQLAMSRLRAVETDRSVVHISTVGVSALIAPDGRQITTAAPFTTAILQASLPVNTDRTSAVRLGHGPETVLGAIGVLGILLARGRRRLNFNRS
jgi:apolipoprotein N-acyltransferase